MTTNSYTPDQKRAIEFFPIDQDKRHLVIEAGAGSGKTTILKERVKFLLREKEFVPEDLVVITFTKNSTAELKHRISQIDVGPILAERLKFIHISTIDSFFASLVESLYPLWWNAKKLSDKIPPPLILLNEKQAIVDLETEFAKSLDTFSTDELSEVADFILAGGLEKKLNTFNAGSPLDSLLNAMLSDVFLATDIDHIRISSQYIHPATQKLVELSHKNAREVYEKRILAGTFTYADRNVFLKENLHLGCPLFFKELIVDEYQDTNHIQHAILWKLVELNHAQMTVVGDPKQSIYAFRGSNVDVFQSLLDNKNWNVISLDMNFRSQSQLLNEVNVLSHLSFDWQTPDLPDAFTASFFYDEAKKKSIGHKPLKAGLKNFDPEKTNVTVPVVLFEYDAPKVKASSNKRDFNENNIKSLGQYLISQVKKHHYQWKDVAILCEKNKQILKIKTLFEELNIPCAIDLKKERSRTEDFVNLIAKSLFNILHDGVYDSLDLFYLFASPLLRFKYEDILFYFLSRSGHQKLSYNSSFLDSIKLSMFDEVLAIVKKHNVNFMQQPFIAWQQCRFELVKWFNQNDVCEESYDFCTQMDNIANNVFAISQIESAVSLKKILNELDIENSTTVLNESENAVFIKTVHGAKGLEWDVVCFYPSMSRYEGADIFSLSMSWPYLDINWLSEDVKALSFLPKQTNQKFSEQDCIYHDEKEKYLWFSDLRNQLEKNYERKRIFYTAFTRPRKKLIFLHPERQGANAARQIDKKFDFSKYEKNYEQDVFLKYAYLIRDQKANAEHLCFSLEEITTQQKQEEIVIKEQSCEFNSVVNLHSVSDLTDETPQYIGDHSLIDEPPSVLIKQKAKRRRAAQRGFLSHVQFENEIFAENSIQNLVHTNAMKTWTEFEIWHRAEDTQSIERRVIDLLALFRKDIFESLFPRLSHTCGYLHNHIPSQSEYVFLVLDFKTGMITNRGIDQVSNYATLIEKLIDFDWFSTLLDNKRPSVFIGLLQSAKSM